MINIVPKINGEIIEHDGVFLIPDEYAISWDNFEHYCATAFIERFHLKQGKKVAWLILKRNHQFDDEQYKIIVDNLGIKIEAKNERGIIQALTTIYFITRNKSVPFCEISDAPKYHYRGINLDCCRHFFSYQHLLKIIEELSLTKINVLHWHLSDDQAYRIESKIYPELLKNEGNNYYKQEEIKELVRFAKTRGIDVIPEIDMPGHTTSMVYSYPYLGCKNKRVKRSPSRKGTISKNIICPSKETTLKFIENLLKEVVPLFKSKYFHIGGDEAKSINWKSCPDCKRKMKELGITKPIQLQTYFQNKIIELITQMNKIPIVWNDSLMSDNLTKNCIVQYWAPFNQNKLENYLENKPNLIFSNDMDLYIDNKFYVVGLKDVYNAKPIIKNKDYSKLTMGLECCLWSEQFSTPKEQEKRLFPRIWALSENAWSNSLNYDDFINRLEPLLIRSKNKNINVCPIKQWNSYGIYNVLRKLYRFIFNTIMTNKKEIN